MLTFRVLALRQSESRPNCGLYASSGVTLLVEGLKTQRTTAKEADTLFEEVRLYAPHPSAAPLPQSIFTKINY